MKQKVAAVSLFVDGAARFKDLCYFLIQDKKLAAKEVEHARFISFDRGLLAHMGDRNWKGVAACVVKKPTEKFVAVGEDGEVFTYVGGKVTEEKITPKPKVLRGVGVVDGLAVACGMKRQVYRRDGEATWTAMHAPAPDKGNAGFEAVSGFSSKELYAVGWNGEIWEWNGKKWVNRASPTNLILTGVCCAGDGKVYVCGQNGTLLRGRHDTWKVVDLGDFNQDFWAVHEFKKRIYLATMKALYLLGDDGLEPVDFGDDAPATCYRLTDAEGVLWSVGSGDVFSFDGATWKRED
ncbi:MAG TPA: hypothetical protein VFC90_08620 [Planctomycetota bacterium]|nr:hypothetical protein [Planctomycetota bacterium]